MTQNVQKQRIENNFKRAASGFEMPNIGFGTWRIGGAMEKDPNNDDVRDIKAIQYAIGQGVNHIDTAEIYAAGYSEILVGQAVQSYPRNSYTLATKAKVSNHGYDDLIAACQASLKRLGTNYIDLYYLHQPSKDIPFEETARALKFLRSEGLIKHYGVCNFSKETQARLQDHLDAPISVNQSHYSLVFREPEVTGLLDYCKNVGTVFTAWRPLLWHYPTLANQPAASAWEKGVYPVLDQVAQGLGETNVQTAISWLISQPNVTVLFKSTKPENIDEVVKATPDMPSSLIEKIRKEFPDQRLISDAVPLS